MKKMILAALALSAVLVSSCNKDGEGGSNATVKFRKANIAGAQMLALASGTGSATKAGSVTSRSLPEHYPSNEGEYVDGVAYVADGTELTFYTAVTGADKGVIKTSVGSENNAGMVVTTMVRLN